MTRTLREVIADLISEAAQTKAELISDKTTSDYRHGWQSGRMAALDEVRQAIAALPQTEPDGIEEMRLGLMSIYSACKRRSERKGLSESRHLNFFNQTADRAKKALTQAGQWPAPNKGPVYASGSALPQTEGSETVREALERLIEHAQNMEHAMHPQEYMEHGPSQVVDAARQALALPAPESGGEDG